MSIFPLLQFITLPICLILVFSKLSFDFDDVIGVAISNIFKELADMLYNKNIF